MGKFLSRFALGAALGLLAIWLWGQLNQEDDDDFEDDDEVIEIPIGNNKQASGASGHVTPADKADDGITTRAKVAANAPTAVKAGASSDEATDNLEWVEGIGPAFNGILSAEGIKTDRDLANASIEQLRATGIKRDDEEFASWIKQAKQRIGGK